MKDASSAHFTACEHLSKKRKVEKEILCDDSFKCQLRTGSYERSCASDIGRVSHRHEDAISVVTPIGPHRRSIQIASYKHRNIQDNVKDIRRIQTHTRMP